MAKRRRMLTALGETELEVLQIVWELERATVADVLEEMKKRREIAYTTVMTVMKKLAKKGYLSCDDSETSYVYAAARKPDEVRQGILSDMLERVFKGSAAALVQTLVKGESLTAAEKSELKKLIDELEDSDESTD